MGQFGFHSDAEGRHQWVLSRPCTEALMSRTLKLYQEWGESGSELYVDKNRIILLCAHSMPGSMLSARPARCVLGGSVSSLKGTQLLVLGWDLNPLGGL